MVTRPGRAAANNALVTAPAVTAPGMGTSASFAAVQPGRVTMTSVRPPCQVALPSGKNELEPAFPLPKVYPLKSCSPGHRFSALVIVQTLGVAHHAPGTVLRSAREHAYLTAGSDSLRPGTGWG